MGAFADRLWRLKQRAGDPSFEEMSVRLGAAASRSSLAAAAKGRSLPSWETTWEFVRVLAVDRLGDDPQVTEKEWREHWRRARAGEHAAPDPVTSPAGPLASPSAAETAPAETGPAETGTTADAGMTAAATTGAGTTAGAGAAAVGAVTEAGALRGGLGVPAVVAGRGAVPGVRGRRRLGLAVGAAAVVVLSGAVTAFVVFDRQRDGGGAGVPPGAVASPDHDDSQFEGDITFPDGTVVPPNSSFTKIWRLRNTGTVVWANRLLARVNEQPCQAPTAVAVAQTKPGETVDIAVTVRTPSTPGRCKIYWKMADEQGRTLFPLKRPIFLDVQVGGS